MYIPGLVTQMLISLLNGTYDANGTSLYYHTRDTLDLDEGMQSLFVSQDIYDYHWRTGNKGEVIRCLNNEVIINQLFDTIILKNS